MSRLSWPLLFLAVLAPHFVVAQDDARTQGDRLRMTGDLPGAVEAYQRAWSEDENPDVAFALASTFALHPQFADSAFHYLALADEDTMRPLWHADFYFLTPHDGWVGFEDTQLDKLENQVSGDFDREYARDLLRIRMKEWAYRYHITLAFRELGPNSPILTALSTAMAEHHAENLIQIERLVAENGWPELSRVGDEAAYAAGNVINHSDLATRQRYLPLLKAVCERDECDWSRYAHILDRTELELGNPQVFGTQMEQNSGTGLYEARKMVDPEHVDERRTSRGMEPLAAQLDRFNASMARDFGSGE